jgi:hypothetical protein
MKDDQGKLDVRCAGCGSTTKVESVGPQLFYVCESGCGRLSRVSVDAVSLLWVCRFCVQASELLPLLTLTMEMGEEADVEIDSEELN